VVSSGSHVAPGLVSVPGAGVLAVASTPNGAGLRPEELPRLLARRIPEVSMPGLGDSALRAACESGAGWAAEEGFIREEDLDLFETASERGEPDALGNRALAAGVREWDPRSEGVIRAFIVGDVLDSEALEEIGLYEGALVFEASVGAGELGRISLDGHRQRMVSRDFGDAERLVAAPADTEEAVDLTASMRAADGYAAARASLLLYALRRAVKEETGGLDLISCRLTGGVEEREGSTLHRSLLARLSRDATLECGGMLCRGIGSMLGSAPAFGPHETQAGGRWAWEEAGLLERIARLEAPDAR
jgi:RNA-splicing ligase RtcB